MSSKEVTDNNEKNNSNFEPLKLFNDSPLSVATHDALNFKDYADVIYESILGTETPCTIGIFGEWGMGKTSMMNMARENIKKNSEDYISVWFNAWQYENEEQTIVPLIATIIKEIKKEIENLERTLLSYEDEKRIEVLVKVEKKVSWLEKVNNALRSVASGVSVEVGGNIPLVGDAKLTFNGKDIVNKYEELMKDAFLEKSLYFDAYEKMEELSVGNSDEKIVIFIDDLDRCLPDKAVKLLENIKLFLSQQGFVFVLGIAREVVEGYLEKRYDKEFGVSKKHAKKYLDKIVQIPILIPTHSSSLDNLSQKMFEKLGDTFDDNLKSILSTVSKESDGNPRTLTRLINRIKINSRISEKIKTDKSIIKDDERIYYFAIACSLQENFPDIYEDIINRESVRNICLNKIADNRDKEIKHEGLSKHLSKENSVLKDFFENNYVKI
jgi:predicted KAP-like P-loop ATPase